MRDEAGDISRGKILTVTLVIELRFVLEGAADPLKGFTMAEAVLCFRVLFLHIVGRGLEE